MTGRAQRRARRARARRPAGLAVARLLHLRGIPSTVLERDHGPHARTQGGSLDLGEYGGQSALHEMRLDEEFAALARPMGQRLCLMDQDGQVLIERDETEAGSYRPEIDRAQLRRLLLDSLPNGTVRWGAPVDTVTPLPRGGHHIVLNDGTAVDADLVIACDGIGSRARHIVTDITPRYTGITFIHADIARPERDSFIARHTGEGSLLAVGEQKAIMAQRNGNGSIRIHFALRTPEDPSRARGDNLDTGAVRARLQTTFADWSPKLLTVLDEVEETFSYWPLYSLPPQQRWAAHSGLTLVGDAAHIMPPFTGEGVNMALLDAVDLIRSLCHERHSTVDDAIGAYERTMLERMAGVMPSANATGDLLLSASGPAALLEQLTTHA